MHIISENSLKRPGYVYDESGVGREGGDININWNHIDGPLLTTSTGRLHWLTLWERAQLKLGLTTLDKICTKIERG